MSKLGFLAMAIFHGAVILCVLTYYAEGMRGVKTSVISGVSKSGIAGVAAGTTSSTAATSTVKGTSTVGSVAIANGATSVKTGVTVAGGIKIGTIGTVVNGWNAAAPVNPSKNLASCPFNKASNPYDAWLGVSQTLILSLIHI